MDKTAQTNLKHIVIVGGGSAGWMTAAALSSLLSPEKLKITLVESDKIGTVGVGEATIPDMINFNRLLGIDEAEFLKHTQGTFKLGIEFIDWGKKGDRYIHPFGLLGADMHGIDFHQYWVRLNQGRTPEPIENFSLCATAAKAGKFIKPDDNPRSVLSHMNYAYHIDATLYARYLRKYAERRGVTRKEGIVNDVKTKSENGHITAIQLDNGERIEGDFYFDCTGFRALLLSQELDVSFKDWSHWLPCDTAQTVASERMDPLIPYTKATAKSAGWQWRIPTQTRTGNGHIYSSKYMDDGEAVDILLDGLDTPAKGEPRKIKFQTGCREKFWDKNVVAIGLSSGFLEPLESTSLYLIQMGISKFISLFPSAGMPQVVSDEYNRQMMQQFEQVRDFIILHYKVTERDDSEFWRYCRDMEIPDSLTQKISLFEQAGRVFRYEDELFSKPSWTAVMLGQNIFPQACDPIVAGIELSQVERSLDSMKSAMEAATQRMPTHEEFLRSYGAMSG